MGLRHRAYYYSWKARLARVKGREEEVAKRYLAGESARSIADDLDVYHFDVLNCLLKQGVNLRVEDRMDWHLKDAEKLYMWMLVHGHPDVDVERRGNYVVVKAKTENPKLVKLLEYVFGPYGLFRVKVKRRHGH